MSDKDNGGPAFPAGFYADTQQPHPFSGLTKREWFAGMTLSGLLAAPRGRVVDPDNNDEITEISTARLAEFAFNQADAMIEESKKETE